jgi:hypothetical protein
MRQKIPITVGRGLDRSSGLAGVSPESPVDVRNVYARDAKMALRPGMAGTGYPNISWGTDILAIFSIKATLEVLFAVYDRATNAIRILRLNPATNVLSYPVSPANGLWGFAVGGASSFPVVKCDEADGQVFFAHAEENISSRLPTIYYTPNFANLTIPGTLTTLTADLDGTGVQNPCYFSGVYAYLEYMFAWGFGSNTEPDRGDIVRFAKPTQPTIWVPENYLIAGVKKDPVLDLCATQGSLATQYTVQTILAVLKSDSIYRIIGDSPDNFGIEVLDSTHGTISARATINVGGQCYTWSNDGARAVRPGGTEPIAQPLELISPLPDSFPSLGPVRLAFVSYDQNRYLLEWDFPDIAGGAVPVPGFSLSLWNAKDPRWTFVTREQPVTCAGVLRFRDVGGAAPAPTGYPSGVTAQDI